MKRSIILAAMALTISAGITVRVAAQTEEQNLTQTQDQEQIQDQVRDQKRLHDGTGIRHQENSSLTKEERRLMREERRQERMAERRQNHGLDVSTIAKDTPSGPGKGQIVSGVARGNGEMQQARIRENSSARNKSAMQGARGAGMHGNKGMMPRGGGRK